MGEFDGSVRSQGSGRNEARGSGAGGWGLGIPAVLSDATVHITKTASWVQGQRLGRCIGLRQFEAAARFCSAFDELRQYLRDRQRRGETVSLAEQRQIFLTRWWSLIAEMQAA